MKRLLLFLLLLVSFNSFAQITLEHSYFNSAVTRIKLENSGEKYYALTYATNELVFYNSDHTLWKTIVLPATIPNSTIPLFFPPRVEIINVSETKINTDTNIEVIFVYYKTDTNVKDCKIISENGTTLLTINNISSVELSVISGLSDKLIATGTTETKVYSIPELVLENTYNYGNLKRIKLENSGEKYYLLDKTNNDAKIYNANHSLWKTASLPKPTNLNYTDIDFISETKINPDALLEIGYSLSETTNNTTTYLSKIVNENNVELLNLPSSRKLVINSIDGLADKLIAELPIYFNKYNTNIYTIPSLSLEKAYENQVSRIKLENGAEKYFTSANTLENKLKIYNADHTVWKTINLSFSSAMFNPDMEINFLAETKINPDALLEFSYTYSTGLLGLGYEYSSRVINENGDILLNDNSFSSLQLNEISGLPTKIIGFTSYPIGRFVFSVGNLSTSDFNKNDNVIMYPNPAKSFININSISTPIIEATIYNINGIVVKKEIAPNITKIDVDELPMGIYIVNLTDFNNQKSTHKITIVH